MMRLAGLNDLCSQSKIIFCLFYLFSFVHDMSRTSSVEKINILFNFNNVKGN